MQTDHGPRLDQPIIEAAHQIIEMQRKRILDLEMLVKQKEHLIEENHLLNGDEPQF